MNSIKKGLSTLAVITISLALFACDDNDDEAGTSPPTSPPTTAPALTLTPQAVKNFAFSWADVDGETEYRLLENPDGSSGYTEVATIPANATSHVLEVFLPGRINASYILRACYSSGCVDSAPVSVTGTLAEAVGYLKASNTDLNDLFGGSVALSADGNTLAVGVEREDSNATGIDGDQVNNLASGSGAVYVFHRGSSSGAWSQQAYVKASNADAGDDFGETVALSADGNTLVVGASGEDSAATGIDGDQADNTVGSSGAVYVFTRNAGVWSQQAYIKASTSEPGVLGSGDGFGSSVALSADGDTLAVGASNEDSAATGIDGDQTDNSAEDSGAVYVFTRIGGVWTQQAYVKASNTGELDGFGSSVALSADGDTLAVGASGEDSSATGIDGDQTNNSGDSNGAGAVYVFTRNADVWSQQAYVKASNSGFGDGFGGRVALSSDGDTLAVAAPGEESSATGIDGNQADNSAPFSGAVYVFVRSADAWSQQAYVKASNTGSNDLFGTGIALSADGDRLAIGTEREDSDATGIDGDQVNDLANDSGAVYVFTRTGGVWSQMAYVKASNTETGDFFGGNVALSGDGSTLAASAIRESSNATGIGGDQTDNSIERSGAVYLY